MLQIPFTSFATLFTLLRYISQTEWSVPHTPGLGTANVHEAFFKNTIILFVVLPKFCTSIVFNFSWDLQLALEKLTTMLMQNFGGTTKDIIIWRKIIAVTYATYAVAKRKPEKKSRLVRDSNPWPLQNRGSTLPIKLTSQLGEGRWIGSL